MYTNIPKNNLENAIENTIPTKNLNKLFCKSSDKMEELPDNSIHLMITSPPYNVGKEYDENLSLDEYRKLLYNVFKEVFRVLIVGGRACVNIANVGRKPYIPFHSFIIEDMIKIGFFMRGEIIWNKGASAGSSTAWGSWKSATNPTLRDVHEYILVFSKGDNGRKPSLGKEDTITKEEFMEFTKSIWTFPSQSAKAIGHPAPFPTELPLRLIKLYTFTNDIVLDPFMGSGQTAIAALQTKRNFIGYDIDKTYCKLAEERIKKECSQTTLKCVIANPQKILDMNCGFVIRSQTKSYPDSFV
ncbi:MAG: site-specific DNA-methyltransferase [Candidatus Aenigmarchaeota archaeon]|nr:site-specific DNA-methyltransferase [Candidatus Aenigmarchaeota archaeon]